MSRDELADLVADMARVLLAVEWGGNTGAMCPTCMMPAKFGHAHTCALDAALRKAGLRG